ncbi:MAG: NAD(P)-dependent oxidoreductase [Butyrivibrio sp.]|nr:NAD(P)-dependent oxidoreductase [Butyrivibrio sp.]
MRVGVTGGTGFIGQYLIRDYGKDFDFVVPIRDKNRIIREETGARYVECDYTVEGLKKALQDCDAVIHLAAKGMPKNRMPLKMEDYLPNVMASASVFEACKEIGITNIINASTKAVWGEQAGTDLLNENVRPRPGDEYGVSKLCGEVLARFYGDVYGMKIKSYRMGEVCGFDLNKGMLNPFWKVLLNASVNGTPIPIYGKGIGGRDLIYVKDVTKALVAGLDKDAEGIYNIGSGRITTNLEIAEAFCRVFKNESGIELHPEKEEWGTTKCLDIEKAKRELGFEADYDLFRIVEDIKQEYSNLGII